ncbi:hypothetical protein ABT390_06840 [Streptomyces aurantiacus]|uniref:Uncharacterized protein n=1 Tax=Streptomyces aurantiacus JA 4570 TaxID=1286094 RepID=S4AXS8_9ACTN|nr:hypothetical protein [Streptomyces aurantiacus]EPH46222.1 hypothetical protein STRAU_0701 [Streptomyces aurantiacus JA 4570]
MSSGQKTMTLFVTVILGLIFVIMGLSANWPLWAWPTTAAILLVIAAVTHNVLSRGADGPAFPSVPEPTPEPFIDKRPERHVTHVSLPSAAPDYDFSFSATVTWTEMEAPEGAPAIDAGGLAVDAVLQRARVLTERQQPTHSTFVQHLLNGALGTMRLDPSGRVVAMAQNVSLSLSEVDRERLFKLSNVRKDEDVWEHERNYERSKRAYLGDDVLKDTGSAVVWWLSRNDEQVEATVDRIGLLARLSAAANNATVAPPFEHLVPPPAFAGDPLGLGEQQFMSRQQDISMPPGDDAGHFASADAGSLDAFLEWFGFSPDDPEVEIFAERLIKLAHVHGKDDVVEDLRRRFGRGDRDDADDTDNGMSAPPDPPA